MLAGVAISILTGDGGVFDRAKIAAEEYNKSVKNEADGLVVWQNKIDEHLKEVSDTAIQTVFASAVLSVGDYVNYNTGTWAEEDFTKITSSSGNPTVNKSASKPTVQGQFGGFTLNQSRNTNSTEWNSSYKPKYSGWRVWDIDGGVVTLISARHPETYYHQIGKSSASLNILKNRDYSMYLNEYAASAKMLTGQEAASGIISNIKQIIKW